MKKIFLVLGCLVSINAFADDAKPVSDTTTTEVKEVADVEVATEAVVTPATVAVRLTCNEIQAKITELALVANPDDEVIAELTKLKADYRRSCARRAAARRTTASSRVVIEVAPAEAEQKPEEQVVVAEVVEETPAVPELSPEEKAAAELAELEKQVEQELANLDAGLCADGTKPNKFGCCGDELFKDLGNAVFACCPRNDNKADCFPPLK